MVDLNPIAQSLLVARTFTESVSAQHFREFEMPLTVMAKAHNLRSVVQAQVILGNAPGWDLVPSYLSFGRVEVVEVASLRHYLLKARTALPVELAFQPSFFDDIEDQEPGTAPLSLLLYEFTRDHLELTSVAAESVKLNGRRRFQIRGPIESHGRWTYYPQADGTPAFDQGAGDDFGDISEDVRILGDDEL